MSTRMIDNQLNYSHKPTQSKQEIGSCVVRTPLVHWQIRTHKIHHNPDLRETTTFPLIVYYVPDHEAGTHMLFCLETPK